MVARTVQVNAAGGLVQPDQAGRLNVSESALWQAIMHGEFDFTWSPWDSIPGGLWPLLAWAGAGTHSAG